jgi:heme/copper-type cytochrome/quinol oxidase subunit 2
MAGRLTGFIWIYGLIVLFATGVIELVIMPAIQFKLAPTLIQSANITLNSTNVTAFAAQVDQTIGFMHAAMYVVMFVIFVYLIFSVFQREENEYYQP